MTTTLLNVPQLAQKQPALTVGGVRAWIFNEEKNGLKDSGAIIRIGKKLMIDEDKFFAWIEAQGAK
ncbi:MAG: hypothetical protein PHN45_09490 [Methylococcales bacterium]|nr:hypothetical protein [Methylococcales bacterium]MDD5754973.1 hypothetical protein [Methylococcales bacterium]